MRAETVVPNQEYRMTIVLDPEYLADPNTVYPIRIDPTIDLNYEDDGANAILDMTLYSNGTSSINSGSLTVGNHETKGIARAVMSFPGLDLDDLGIISITSATVYVRDLLCAPQESGTKTELKWMKVTDDNGKGLMITSDIKFSASALPLGRRQLDLSLTGGERKENGDVRHSLDLKKLACENQRSLGKTYVNFDLKQMGVACVNSWGAWPREEHLVKGDALTFRFVMSPVNN